MEIATKQDLENWRKLMLEDIKTLINKNETAPQSRWIKSKEAREVLQCSPGKLNSLKGVLRNTKLNGTLYWDYNHIAEMLELGATN